jgi:GDP-D-mannose dehydratase
MKNLIIGDKSQLSHFFPAEYERVSSRDIDFSQFDNQKFHRVFITLACPYNTNVSTKFNDINVDYTLKIINYFLDKANYIVTYGTCDLWNDIDGAININTPKKFISTPYCESKYNMIKEIKEVNLLNPKKAKVIVIHPFNFNSPYRKSGFLFSKVFDSIINKTKITIGDTYFYRDMTHPSHIVERSINTINDELVGSGRLTFVNDFIRDLYFQMDMNYDDFVTEDNYGNTQSRRKLFYLKTNKCKFNYHKLVYNTINDIKKLKI